MKWLLLILFFLCNAAQAQWTTEQKQWAGVWVAATFIDYGQTRYSSQRLRYTEQNPFLGEHPSLGRVNTYFAVLPVAAYFFLDSLESKNRTTVIKVLASVEVLVVARNAYIGIRTDF